MSKILNISGEVRAKDSSVKPVSLAYEFNDGFPFETLVGMVNNVPVPDGARFVVTDMRVSADTHNRHEPKSLWGQSGDSGNVHYLSEWTKAEISPLDSGDTDIACRISSLLDGLEETNLELFDGEAVELMYLLMDRYTGRNKERNKNKFDEPLVSKNNDLPIEDGFYRNGDGSIVINVSNEGFYCLNLKNGEPLSLDEMMENAPWTKVAFVDVES